MIFYYYYYYLILFISAEKGNAFVRIFKIQFCIKRLLYFKFYKFIHLSKHMQAYFAVHFSIINFNFQYPSFHVSLLFLLCRNLQSVHEWLFFPSVFFFAAKHGNYHRFKNKTLTTHWKKTRCFNNMSSLCACVTSLTKYRAIFFIPLTFD